MERNSCESTIWMPVLLVRPALPNFNKAESFQDRSNFAWFKDGIFSHRQPTMTVCVPTNSASKSGSPSSSNIPITSRRLVFSSSKLSAWVWAPGKPGTYPTYIPVSGQRSTTAVYVFIILTSKGYLDTSHKCCRDRCRFHPHEYLGM